ncbi:MAG: hypothetical protein AAF533_04790 [Acidobacteriota bacterium]
MTALLRSGSIALTLSLCLSFTFVAGVAGAQRPGASDDDRRVPIEEDELKPVPVPGAAADLICGGANWSLRDAGGGSTAATSGSCGGTNQFVVVDASLGGFLDAFDNAYHVFVDGIGYEPPSTSNTACTYDCEMQVLSDLGVTVSATASSTHAVLRLLYRFSNTTGADIDATVEIPRNWGSDITTTIAATSSGDTTLDLDDRWIVTHDLLGPGDVINISVAVGPGSPMVMPSVSTPSVFTCVGEEGWNTSFDIEVPAGESRSLLLFHGLGDLTGGNAIPDAVAAAAGFDDIELFGDLLSGLTDADLAEVLNWSFPSTADLEPVQAAIDAVESKLDASLDVDVSTRASQVSVDSVEAKLDVGLDVAVSTRASQLSIDQLQMGIDALEVKSDLAPCETFDLLFPLFPNYPVLPIDHPCTPPSCDSNGFEGLTPGSVVTTEFPGIIVSGSSDVVVFDSADPTCNDDDLRTPTGVDGNVLAKGHVLVLQEPESSCWPNDAEDGGLIRFDLDSPTRAWWIGVLDVEESGSLVRVLDDHGVLAEVAITPTPGGGWTPVLIDVPGVTAIEVSLAGSGAITDLVCR